MKEVMQPQEIKSQGEAETTPSLSTDRISKDRSWNAASIPVLYTELSNLHLAFHLSGHGKDAEPSWVIDDCRNALCVQARNALALATQPPITPQVDQPETSEFSFILKPSPIHGVGVFAAHDIAKNVRLRLFPESDVVRYLPTVPPLFDRYVVTIDSPRVMCPADFGRMSVGWYLNDSQSPNVSIVGDYEYISNCEIEAGEELTISYEHLEPTGTPQVDQTDQGTCSTELAAGSSLTLRAAEADGDPFMDWTQVALNGGPPCFHVEELGGGLQTYCGRAERWAGHGMAEEFHNFVSLNDLLLQGVCVYCGELMQYKSLEQKAGSEGGQMRVDHIRQCAARPELKLIAYAEKLQEILRKWAHWYSVDSTEQNRDDAYAATCAALNLPRARNGDNNVSNKSSVPHNPESESLSDDTAEGSVQHESRIPALVDAARRIVLDQIDICPVPGCGDRGYYAEGPTDAPEQVQCEFCCTMPNSLFNVQNNLRAALEPFESLSSASPTTTGETETTPLTDDQILESLAAEIEEKQRLESLAPLALIHEVLQDSIADDPRVQELMSRVLPNYENIAKDGTLIEPDYPMARTPAPSVDVKAENQGGE